LPNWDFWFEKDTIWQPWFHAPIADSITACVEISSIGS
jgi:hypothetical protein